MALTIPRPKISKEQLDKFLKDPEIVTLEILFVALTLCNIFVLYRILLNVCPFPVVVTWAQLLVGFLFAFVLGEASREFPRCAFFPPFSVDIKLYEGLALPTLVYLGMITMANVLLHVTPSIATFPVVVSFAVALHHASRFIGCGQIYMPIRWLALAIMVFGFFIAIFDRTAMGYKVLPLALLYAVFSSVFRAWCLEKAMHVVEGRGNMLHNHQVMMGLLLLPFLAVFVGEWRVFTWMPTDPRRLFTWQAWGCLVTAGTIPFIKNIVANRMIRRTGQAPWRFLEIASMVLVFLVGWRVFDMVSLIGTLASLLVVSGRVLGMLDALSKEPEERRRAIRREPVHAAPPGRYDVTGVPESFERMEEEEEVYEQQRATQTTAREQGGDVEMGQGQSMRTEEPSHMAVKPLLTPIDEEDETRE